MSDQIIVYGTTWCPDCQRSKQFLTQRSINFTWVDIEQHPEAVAIVEEVNNGNRSVPTIVFPDGDVLVEPSNAQLAQKLNAGIVMYGATWCPDCTRAKAFFDDNNVDYRWIDIEQHPEAVATVEDINNGYRSIPTIIFPDGDVLVEPSNRQLAEKINTTSRAKQDSYDVVIVGGGPAGLTAALYATREGLSTLIIDKGQGGGQINNTQWLDNFPGFEAGVSGAELATRLTTHAQRFGGELLSGHAVTDIRRAENNRLTVETDGGDTYRAGAVLLATGTQYRHLNVPGERELIGSNIHFCATCDGAFYRDKDVLVVGGGNSGFEEGLFLTNFAKHVTIVEFMPEVKASQVLKDRVAEHADMTVITNHAVQEFSLNDDGTLDAILVQNRATGAVQQWKQDGIFVFIGLTPNTGFLPETIERDRWGFVLADDNLQTSLPGVFVAGDVRNGSTRQAVSAAGEGSTVALKIRHYLDTLEPVATTDAVAIGD